MMLHANRICNRFREVRGCEAGAVVVGIFWNFPPGRTEYLLYRKALAQRLTSECFRAWRAIT